MELFAPKKAFTDLSRYSPALRFKFINEQTNSYYEKYFTTQTIFGARTEHHFWTS